MMTMAPTILTPRLCLRAPQLDDFETHAAMWADPRVTTFIGGTPRDRHTSWLRFIGSAGTWPLLGFGYWVIADRDTDRLIGMGGLGRFERGIAELDGFPEAGWAVAADHWGQGLVSEAMDAAMRWADTEGGFAETRCIIEAGHGASVRIAEKLGFAHIGHSADAIGSVDVYARKRGVSPNL